MQQGAYIVLLLLIQSSSSGVGQVLTKLPQRTIPSLQSKDACWSVGLAEPNAVVRHC